MSAIIHLTPQQITEEDIITIYKLFCQAFEVKHNKLSDDYFKERGLKELRENGRTSYSAERSLFEAWYEGNGTTRFNGCSTFEDQSYVQKIEKFRELMKEKYQ